jgi:endoglucanase
VLSWGVIDYEEAYVKAGELENVHKAIKWGTDYFLKVLLFY